MKTRYVLLTALSALLVGAGANAEDAQVASTLKVATQAYTDTHLRGKNIAEPSPSDANKVVVYDGSKFGYTNQTVSEAGDAIDITNGKINVKYDGTRVQKDEDNQLTVPVFSENEHITDRTEGPAVEPGLVPGAQSKLDWNKWLSSDGNWRYISGINGLTGTSYNSENGRYEIGLNIREGSAIDTDSQTGVDVKVDGITITKATDGTLSATQVDISGKADQAETLAGYGITDAYTKTETDSAITTKVDALNAEKSGTDAGVTVTVKEVKGLIDTVSVDVADGAFVGDLDATVSQTAGADGLALTVVEEDGKLKSVSGSIAANTYDAFGAAKAVQGETTATVKDLEAEIDSLETEIDNMDATVSHTAGADGLALEVVETDGKLISVTGSIAANTYDAYGAATTAVNALDATVSKEAGADGLALEVVETDGKLISVTGSIAANTYDAYGAASDVQGDTTKTVKDVEDAVDGLADEVGDITTLTTSDTSSTVAAINELKAAADGKITKPTTNCTTGHMCALVQSGSDAPVWVDLTAIGGTEPNLQY